VSYIIQTKLTLTVEMYHYINNLDRTGMHQSRFTFIKGGLVSVGFIFLLMFA